MRDYKTYFAGKRITLMGLGLLGRGVGDARFLAPLCKELIVTDLKSEEQLQVSLEQLKEFANITYHLDGHRLEDFRDVDLVIKAAGVPLNSPFVAEARKQGIPVRMSADLFAQLGGTVTVGITGTRGKSTATHLLAHILQTAGLEVFLGGNVRGVSTLELLSRVNSSAIAVLELDSWQLQGFGEMSISPHVAVFTTFMPDHMNYYHNDMHAYFADKANIFLNQAENDFLILGEQVTPFIKEYHYHHKIRAHTIIASAKDIPASWHLQIPGEHNRYDAGLAAAAARTLSIDQEYIRKGIESFTGVPGRLQLVREVHGVKIYNDTTATVPEATLAALHALGHSARRNIILIMGGADKMLDMHALLLQIPQYCKQVLLLPGSGTERIKSELPDAVIYASLAPAMKTAMATAKEGDIILLSPAFTSFGMFINEYERGAQFDALVASL